MAKKKEELVTVQELPTLAGEYVLIRQTMKNKNTKLILAEGAQEQIITFEILKFGPQVPAEYGLKLGAFPIFGTHFQAASNSIEDFNQKTKEGSMLVIAHYLDILGMK